MLMDADRTPRTLALKTKHYHPQYSRKHEFHVCTGSSCTLSFIGVMKRDSDRCCVHIKFVPELQDLKLREPKSFIKGSNSANPLP